MPPLTPTELEMEELEQIYEDMQLLLSDDELSEDIAHEEMVCTPLEEEPSTTQTNDKAGVA